MDIIEIQREDQSKLKIYAILSLTWAIVKDCDLGSEACRCCGNARYDFYGLWRLLNLRRYNGVLRFKGHPCHEV